MYCCIYCGSGTGKNGTGAVKYYKDTNTCYCHSCNKHFDILDIVQSEYGTDLNGALEIGARELNITIDNAAEYIPAPKATEKPQEQEPAIEIDNTAYYEKCRANLNDPKAISYLSARGISVETAAAANIGFDAEADPAQSGYKTPRIIIPTSKSHYVARRIDGGEEYAKMNNKGGKPSIFNEQALYSGAEYVFVVEGAFDALSLLEIGQQAIATNSANNASKLLEILKEKPTAATLVICKDNDTDPNTREKINKYAAELEQGLNGLNITFKEANITGTYKDANEALQGDKEAFKSLVEASIKKETDIDRFLISVQSEAYKPAATGLKFFDDLMNGGIVNKTVTVVLAAPAAGKTTLCQQIAEAIAKQKRPVIYLNLEMAKDQMLAKSISAMMARKNNYKTALDILQGYRWNSVEKEQITAIAREYEQNILPYLKYKDAAETGSGVNSILSYLEKLGTLAEARGKQAPVIVLDYLHLVTNDTGKNLETQELIKQIIVGLKSYAIKHNTFVIAISATNRTSNNGKLTLDSARDSSNIDYTGDYAISLNYEEIDNGTKATSDIDELQQESPRRMILRVVKGRFIATGKSVKVYYNAAYNMFYANDDFVPANQNESPFAPIKRI